MPKNIKLVKYAFVFIATLNFGNYSYLFYDIGGQPLSGIIVNFFKYLRILIPIFLLLYLLRISTWRALIGKLWKENMLLYIFCLICIANSVLSSSVVDSFIYGIWLFVSTLFIGVFVHSTYNVKELLHYVKMGSAVTLLIVIPSIPMMWTLGNDYTFFSSKNYYAYPVLIYFIAELAIFKLSDRIRYKVFRVSVLIIILAILLLSGRRSTLICAVLAMLFHFTNLRTAIVFGVLTFLAVINIDFTEISIFGFDIQQTSTYQRINRVDFNNFHDTSIQARRNVWNLYLERFYDSPVFGSGLHSGEAVLGNVYSGVVEKIGYHNTFLQVLIEVGIVGFFFFILYALKSMLAMRTNLPFFLPLFIPTLLVNYFEANLLPGQLLFIYTITIWIALNRYKKHRKTNFCIKRGYIIHGKEVSIQKNIKSIRR